MSRRAPSRASRLPAAMAAVALATMAWVAVGIAVPATFGAHVAVDEPQYLLTATSLFEDLDLDIADELEAERWRAYHDAPLPEQTAERDDGRRYSPHDPLLPVLLAVPMGLGGWVAAKAAMAALAGALAATLLWLAVRRFGVPTGPAAVAVLCFTLSPPLAVYATQVYPEVAAALAAALGVAAVTGAVSARSTLAAGLAVVALPWLSVKYAPVAAAVAAVGLWRWWRAGRGDLAVALAAGLAGAAVVYAVAHLAVYGGLTPYAAGDHFTGGELTVAGTSPDLWGRGRRLAGLLVDRDFGLAAWQPAWLLGVPALGAVARRRPAGWAALALPLAAGWLTAAFVALTMHGFWWPGRQTVVVLPLLALAVAWWAGAVPAARRLVAAGLVAGAVTYLWLAVEGIGDRLTWVTGFGSTTGPVHQALRPLLPDLRALTAGDEARYWLWVALLAALALAGWRASPASAGGGGGRGAGGDEDAAAGEGADADHPAADGDRDRAVG